MSIFFLTLYIMFWILGICASYAFVMAITKKDASISFLRWASLLSLVSYGVSWFFGVLYYVHPDTVARIAHAIPPSSNIGLYSLFMQLREYIFLSFVFVPLLAGLLAVMVFLMRNSGAITKKKNGMISVSILLTILGVVAVLLAQMIAF